VDELIGRTIASYRILEPLGRGGMGVVYLAEDVELGRQVALKLLPAGALDDPERRQRFEREARTLAAVTHPHIATPYAAGEDGGIAYLAMERLPGPSLEQMLEAGPLPVARAVAIARDVASALACAHAADIVHRDVKPGNVMLGADGEVKLMDFGLAKLAAGSARRGDPGDPLAAFSTEDGIVVGSPMYMSPEHAQGLATDERSDLFSLGSVLYEMVSGRAPFRGLHAVGVLLSLTRGEVAPLHEAPPALRAIVERCMAPRPEDRFASAQELVDALDALAPEVAAVGDDSRRWSLLFGAAAVAAAIAVAVYVLTS
jgi:serine/threonine-protein kinase